MSAFSSAKLTVPVMSLLVAAYVFSGLIVTTAHAGRVGVLQLQNQGNFPATTWVVKNLNSCTAQPRAGTKIVLPANGGLSRTFDYQRHDGDCDGKGGYFELVRQPAPAINGAVVSYSFSFTGDGEISYCRIYTNTDNVGTYCPQAGGITGFRGKWGQIQRRASSPYFRYTFHILPAVLGVNIFEPQPTKKPISAAQAQQCYDTHSQCTAQNCRAYSTSPNACTRRCDSRLNSCLK